MTTLSIERLQKLPAIQAAIAEAESHAMTERAAMIDRYNRALSDFNAAEAKDARTDAKLAAELEEARERVRALESRVDALRTTGGARRLRWRRDCEVTRQAIVAGADKRLQAFQLWAQRAANLVNVRSYGGPLATTSSGAQLDHEKRRHAHVAQQVRDLSAQAFEIASSLQMRAVTEADVDAALQPLRDEIIATAAQVGVTIPADYAARGGLY